MNRVRQLALLVVTSAAMACSALETVSPAASPLTPVDPFAVTPRGARHIAIDVSPASDGDFEPAFQMAVSAGMDRIGLFQNWDTLEPTPGNFDGRWPQIADLYYPAHGVSLDLTIAVIHTNQTTAPSDLRDLALNDPVVIRRFEDLLDFVFAQLPHTDLQSIVIGSEHDIYLGTDVAAWQAFQDFYRHVSAHVRSTAPGIAVATELTFAGLTGPMRATAAQLNASSDLIGVSYYPMAEDGKVRDPGEVGPDFDRIAGLYPSQPIVFYQTGYPSSERLGSSEARQAEFIAEIFAAWDRHADRIPMIDFTWLHDASPESVQDFEDFYGLSGEAFHEFLASLGLRTYDGRDKLAFQRLVEEVEARGW